MEKCRESELIYRKYIYPTLYACVVILLVLSVIIYVKAYFRNELNTKKKLFHVGLIFFAIIIAFFISRGIWDSTLCNGNASNLWDTFNVLLYSLQGWLLAMFLFIKLQNIFRDTAFVLSSTIMYGIRVRHYCIDIHHY